MTWALLSSAERLDDAGSYRRYRPLPLPVAGKARYFFPARRDRDRQGIRNPDDYSEPVPYAYRL